MSVLKQLWRQIAPNPFDRLLSKHRFSRSVLIVWNRGLGDIALGLYAMIHRIREKLPHASITFLTRPDLEEGFNLLEGISVLIDPQMERGKPYQLPQGLADFDLMIEDADPTYWVAWQRGNLVPKLRWNPEWESLCQRFSLPQGCLGAHVHCETNYYHERNWPASHWQTLFEQLNVPIVLFGKKKDPLFPNTIDLRGDLSLYELLSVIKCCCSTLIAPDSGILSMAYYLNTPFPLHVISLWADPNHGILKQNVRSPNFLLKHTALISSNRKNAALISPQEVLECIPSS